MNENDSAYEALGFTINEATCIQCGLCAEDCPRGIIDMEQGIPKITESGSCIHCLHCFAICPTGSLSILGQDPDNAISLEGNMPHKDQLAALIKGRRSIRHYHPEDLPAEVLDEALHIVWHAPTGVNSRQVLMTVADRGETVRAIKEEVYRLISEDKDIGNREKPVMQYLGWAQKMWAQQGEDVIFRNAPHFIVTSAPKNSPSPLQDTHILLAYLDLLAPTMGLGTLWNGMFKWTLELFPEIPVKLGIPDDHLIGYTMLIGRPAMEYQRTVDRGFPQINRISLG
jgi:nitroreductase/NAD-dependent dihydropyrimidine dehydrogenase PreA subunit